MSRLVLPALAAALLAVAAPATAGEPPRDPVDRVPHDLPGDAAALRGQLENASRAEDVEELRRAVDGARPLAGDLLPLLRDLQGDERSGDVLAELWSSLETAAAEGNLSDGRSLAGSAADTLEDDLEPRARRWAANDTAVTAGRAHPAEGGTAVPIVIVHPPPGGLGALDASISVDPDRARPRSASLEVGRGDAAVDPANGTARAASFSPQALAGLDPGGPPATVFARAVLDPVGAQPGDRLDVEVAVEAAADTDGNPALVVAPDGQVEVQAAEAGPLAGLPAAWGGLAAVGLLGIGAALAFRRVEV